MGRYAVCSRDDAEVRDDEHGVPRAGLDQAPHRPREIDYRPVTDHDVSIRLCTEKSNLIQATGRGRGRRRRGQPWYTISHDRFARKTHPDLILVNPETEVGVL